MLTETPAGSVRRACYNPTEKRESVPQDAERGREMSEKTTYFVAFDGMTKEGDSWNSDGMASLIYLKEFETYEEAKADFDELDPKAEFLKTYGCTTQACLMMKRKGYCAEIYTEDDSVEFKSYTYDDYRKEF